MHAIQGTKIALLIDFDNVILGVDDPGFDVELVVNALRSRGVVVMGRAYGDWYRHHRHRRKLMEQGIELVETPVFGPVIKNSADIRIVLDGIDVATSHPHIDAFCLVSGDSDFLPLIKRLQLLGKSVIVIAGQKFTSELVRRNCNEYIAYENLLAESVGATEDVSSLEGAFKLLQRAMNTLNERGMDMRSSTVKQMMLQLNPAFSERTFACSQFKQFLDRAARAGIVKLGDRDGTSGEYAVILTSEVETQSVEAKLTPTQRDSARNTTSRQRGERFSSSRRRGEESQSVEPAAEASTGATETVPTAADETTTSPEAVDDLHVAPIPSTPLSARSGLRRGRLRFSAKNGRSTVVPRNSTPADAPTDETTAPTDDATSQTPETVQEDAVQAAAADVPTDVTVDAPSAMAAEAVEGAATPDTTFASDVPAANEDSPAATTEEASAPATPKKRTTRGGRRRKPAVATGASDAAPTTDAAAAETADAGAADNSANAASADVAVESASTEDSSSADAPATDAAATDAPAAEGEAAPAKKTTRGRRGGTRRSPRTTKAAAPPAEDAS